MADRCEYRLSDAFEPKVDNPALMEQCRTLADYARYVALVRKYKSEMGSLEAAVRRAYLNIIRKRKNGNSGLRNVRRGVTLDMTRYMIDGMSQEPLLEKHEEKS